MAKKVAKKRGSKKRVSSKKAVKREPIEKQPISKDTSDLEELVSGSFFDAGAGSSFAAYDGESTEKHATRGAVETRRALCIGIDDYPNPRDQLGGCVSDAAEWGKWLKGRGFSVESLTNAQASRSGILNGIGRYIRDSQPGDIVAIQYAGHGTQLPDLEGEERDGKDEALVPHDHRKSGYVVDDDLKALCSQIPTGVSVTFLMDCCHSGTMTRLFVGPESAADGVRSRFLKPDDEMLAAHKKQRATSKPATASRSSYRGHKEILLSACRADQTAKERNKQGDFTRYALQVLKKTNGSLTNAELIDRVLEVGKWENQRPQLWSDPKFYNQMFLGAGQRSSVSAGNEVETPATGNLSETLAELESVIGKLRSQLG